jgi:parvulin-like peptidyl-prolyl isomerase
MIWHLTLGRSAGILAQLLRNLPMFIAHGEKVRKHARWIMAGILILLIPGFIMLFTTTGDRGGRGRNSDMPSINGKAIDPNVYQQAYDDLQAEAIISTGRTPGRTAAEEDQLKQQTVLRILLLRKAKEMGLRVTDLELQQHIQSQPIFANDAGQFDPRKYAATMQYLVNNYSITPVRFEELMRQQLLINRLQHLITAAAKATPEEVSLAYTPLHERLIVQLVEFNATNSPLPTVTEAEAKAAYESSRDAFRIPRRVEVRYALFSLAEAKKAVKVTDSEVAQYYEHNQTRFTDEKGNSQPLAAVTNEIRNLLTEQRVDQKAGDAATDFSIKLVQDTGTAPKPDFVKQAQETGATIGQTGYFTLQGPVEGLEVPPAFRKVAFTLTPENPYSDPIPSGAGYYVLQYLGDKPSEIPPFTEVKDKVIAQLQKVRQFEASFKTGHDTLAQLRQAMASGKNFDAACAGLALHPHKVGPFAVSDDKVDLPGGMMALEAVLGMATNTLSDLVRIPAGTMIIYLQDRQPPASITNSQEVAQMASIVLRQNQQALFNDWVRTLVQDENVSFGRMRSAPTNPATGEPLPE